MKFLTVSIAVFSFAMFAQTSVEAKLDRKQIAGSYISQAFEATNSSGQVSDIRNELLVLHCDETAARYISTSIGSLYASQNDNGIELTPSFGTWEIDGNTVKAVFFDFFNHTPCTPEARTNKQGTAAKKSDYAATVVDCTPAAQVIAVEYDLFTYTIKFSHEKNGKF